MGSECFSVLEREKDETESVTIVTDGDLNLLVAMFPIRNLDKTDEPVYCS